MNYIELENLSFSYEKGNEILKNISLCINKHESVGIIGANGVGKSTLFRILVGLEKGYTGKVIIDGLPVIEKNFSNIRRKTGYVFQDSENQLFTSTVYDDIAFAPRNYGYSNDKVHDAVLNTLKILGIEKLKDRQTYKMSGGEKKLVAIGTILSLTPDIILMDEPTITLDPKNRRNLINIINTLDQTKIIATHDLDMILDTCNRVIIMSEGKVIKDGLPKEILKDKEFLEKCGLECPLCYTLK